MSEFKYNEPIERKMYNFGNYKHSYQEGEIVLMCPHCLHMETISVTIDNKVGRHNINDFYTETKYHGDCPNCKEFTEFECMDVNIAETIKILNSKGYYTAFSCEGHIEEDVITCLDTFSDPYIYFYFWKDSEILKEHPLPETWKLDDNDIKAERFSIHDNITDSIPEELWNDGNENKFILWLCDNWDKEKRLKDIYDWAVSLPDRDKEFKQFKFNFAKTCGKTMLLNSANRYIEAHNKSILETGNE